EVGGAWPTCEPLLVDGQDPVHRGLLEHELTDHHSPRTGLRTAPRQVPGVLVEPVDDGGVQRLTGSTLGRGIGGAAVRGLRWNSHDPSILPRRAPPPGEAPRPDGWGTPSKSTAHVE